MGFSFNLGGSEIARISSWDVSNNTITVESRLGELSFDVTFSADETKMTVSGLTGDVAAGNGTYTRVEK